MKKIEPFQNLILLFLSALLLSHCAPQPKFSQSEISSQISSHNVRIDSTLADDRAMDRIILPYRTELNRTMGQIVGHAAVALTKKKPEGTLNNFVADLMLKRANCDFPFPVSVAITNRGGLRVNIPKGAITLGKIYEVMPFENELVVLEMTGAQLVTLAKQIGEVGGECIAGMRLEYDGQTLKKMTVQGKFIEPDKIYYLVTTDYLSSQGRRKLSILGQVKRNFLGVRLRDAILEEVKSLEASGKEVSAAIDGRIIIHAVKNRNRK
ncbi:hypothetical protein B1H10_00205 [candidate division KSB1 bacterium 4484_188]|nr:MAG: hypothetical protein B1H10_00205 [candidate division KSB1 bacterium 4484_188]